jgi:ribosomal protein L11 methyltransferase
MRAPRIANARAPESITGDNCGFGAAHGAFQQIFRFVVFSSVPAMPFRELRILSNASETDALSDALMDLGALSVSLEDADLGTPDEKPLFGEPGMEATPGTAWERSWVVALFGADETDDRLKTLMDRAFRSIDLEEKSPTTASQTRQWRITDIDDQDWVRLTQSQFDPIQVSARLWIVPSWHVAPDPSAITITLDPGLAFGTGSHPTTHLCLQWIDAHVRAGASVLDYGCGSGILAIAAAKLGATEVQATDIDPQAVIATQDNAAANGVSLDTFGSAARTPRPAQHVVANILTNPLKALAPALVALVTPGGTLTLSGILEDQEAEIIATYRPYMPLARYALKDGWTCLAGTKPLTRASVGDVTTAPGA